MSSSLLYSLDRGYYIQQWTWREEVGEEAGRIARNILFNYYTLLSTTTSPRGIL